jgi:TolB-like protein/DNA-binding winged helix-turn-helix (wHTH) protein
MLCFIPPFEENVPAASFKFDEFELDCSRFELRRNGRTLKLERIPMELLILLVERDGAVVTRQEIVERLWGKDVFVDTEHGINTAIRKIRAALRDRVDNPRFLLTVVGKGYRLVREAHNGVAHEVQVPKAKPDEPAKSAMPPAHRRWPLVACAALLLLLLAGALLAWNMTGIRNRHAAALPPIRSIAVLPLANLSGDRAQDYFADGMTDELITMLAKNASLRVVSRTSAMQYKGVQRPVRDIARELGVDSVLEGSLERLGNRVHMNVQLIRADNDSHVWAESYDRDFNDALALPSELSQTIAKEVKIATSTSSPPRYIDPAAHDAYLRGRYFWFAFNSAKSREYFEKAIEVQPDYAAAWGGLADVYVVSAVAMEVPAKDVMAKAEVAAQKAAVLDDSLAEVHNALAGLYLFGRWDLNRADVEATRAIALDPGLAEIHHLRAYILEAMNRPDEALQEQRRCTELDRFARPWALGVVLTQLRKFDAAISELRLLIEAQPRESLGQFLLADAYRFKGMWQESAKAIERGYLIQGDEQSAAAVRHAFEIGGDKAVEELALVKVKARARKRYVSPMELAFYTARLQRKEETLKFLDEAYNERSPWLVLLQYNPDFDFLHSEERYRALVKKIGLTPAY